MPAGGPDPPRRAGYFRKCDDAVAKWAARAPADGPGQPLAPTLTVSRTVYPRGWPEPPGLEVLQHDYPAVISIGGDDYPSVEHAYWALSAADRHPHLAAALLSTRDARIVVPDRDAAYWCHDDSNRAGRLLEVVRSELAAAGSGLPPT